jgi:hypothetical protein
MYMNMQRLMAMGEYLVAKNKKHPGCICIRTSAVDGYICHWK